MLSLFFFFNDTATTEIYTLSLHDALPICPERRRGGAPAVLQADADETQRAGARRAYEPRSEEHTSELQSQSNLVCRLLLEKKKKSTIPPPAQARRRNSRSCRASASPTSSS